MKLRIFKIAVFFVLIVAPVHLWAQDIELERKAALDEWGSLGIVLPDSALANAQRVLALPLADQSVEELIKVAEQSNIATNLLKYILKEYRSYDNRFSQYEFIWDDFGPKYNGYRQLSNQLISNRNQSYYNLGLKAVERGEPVLAFLYFHDAYRLSEFIGPKDESYEGMRYKAELEMKKILGLERLESYTYYEL